MSLPTTDDVIEAATGPEEGSRRPSGPTTLSVDRIVPNPHQPRKQFDPDKLAELARSLTSAGMIQPVVVRPHGDQYELVAGQRRWQAAKQAGLREIPAVIREATDDQMLQLALIENIHREDLNAIERGEAYRAYCEQFGRTPDEMAGELGEDRTTITNYIRLLDLPDGVKDLVAGGRLSMGHARALLGLADPQEQADVACLVTAKSLSVRQLEALVRLRKSPPDETDGGEEQKEPSPAARPHILDLEDRLSRSVGTKVRIHEGRVRHTGRITVEYYSLDDFDRISERLGLNPE